MLTPERIRSPGPSRTIATIFARGQRRAAHPVRQGMSVSRPHGGVRGRRDQPRHPCHDLAAARRTYPHLVFQGNVDEEVLRAGTPEQVAEATRALRAGRGRPTAHRQPQSRRRPGNAGGELRGVCQGGERRASLTGVGYADGTRNGCAGRRGRGSARRGSGADPTEREFLEKLEAQVRRAVVAAEPAVACIAVSRSEHYPKPAKPDDVPGRLGGFDRAEFLKANTSVEARRLADQLDLADRDNLANRATVGGVVIDPTGLVLTPYHAIEGATKLYVFLPGKAVGSSVLMRTSTRPMPAATWQC